MKKLTILTALGMFFMALISVGMPERANAAQARTLGTSDTVPEPQCKANPTQCVCAIGLINHTFVSSNGLRFVQCIPSRCQQGMVLRETRTYGGRSSFRCVSPEASQPYIEPIPKPLKPKPRVNKTGQGNSRGGH